MRHTQPAASRAVKPVLSPAEEHTIKRVSGQKIFVPLMKQLAIPLSNQNMVAKWLVIAIRLGYQKALHSHSAKEVLIYSPKPNSSPFKGEVGSGMGSINQRVAPLPHPHPSPPLEGEGINQRLPKSPKYSDISCWLTIAKPALSIVEGSLVIAAAMLLAFPVTLHAAGEFAGLGFLPGDLYSRVSGISADGSVAVGYSSTGGKSADQAFRWTQSGGMTGLGFLPGGKHSYASGVSADGSVVVGQSRGGSTTQAFRWTQPGGMTGLGFLTGGKDSYATGVSADGSVVVGSSGDQAFRWTKSGGMTGLGILHGYTNCRANGVSADGSVVVGHCYGADKAEGFRWTKSGGMTGLGFLPGGVISVATGVSADGSVVAGYANNSSGDQAFRWTKLGGMTGLGFLTGGAFSKATGISADGSVVVGFGSGSNGKQAFRWTQATRMQSIGGWLGSAGATLPAGWENLEATAANLDGSVVVGNGISPAEGYRTGFRIKIPATKPVR